MPMPRGIGIPINVLILMERAIIQSWFIQSIYKHRFDFLKYWLCIALK